ncbi:gamma-glutamyltransferase [Phormidium sp. CCY1219]|uniref:gamma-glutamyltransferase n=1 Tax=Phormidium sp. CCY1219 TaxID=2886104 RepID=UPI002D1EDA19|nr:gamma-glutamyltransferase [Phormidium sp. CCY1219]MEB3827321.1 gamma-glutamyltransferase [Phormidium sp. CCY1219]
MILQHLRRFSFTVVCLCICLSSCSPVSPIGERQRRKVNAGIPPDLQSQFVQPQRSKLGMAVSAHPLATEAGVAMLEDGGNAMDAAVATALAISVVEPFSAGIGGGGFLLLREAETGKIRALDFRERAPMAASRDMYLDDEGKVKSRASLDGHLAVGVPGTVAGLYELHREYGKLPWSAVVKPAIRLAQEGFELSDRFIRFTQRRRDVLLQNTAAKAIFTRQGQMYEPGDILVQKDLANTLKTISQDPESFYSGKVAWAIAQDMQQHGGLITLNDLINYEPIWRDPICGNFRDARICSMPPPSSGGVHLLQILNIIGETDLADLGWQNPDALHLMVESMRIAYADRAAHLGDPDFVEVPVRQLTSKEYAKQRREEIQMDRVRRSDEVTAVDEATLQRLQGESTNTTHLTIVDRDRNVVSMTFTINGGFGAGVVAAGTGIVLNNEMDDFAIAPGVPNLYGLVGDEANAIAPRKTPLSSMTPIIATRNGRFLMAAGSPGGSTIITTVLQIALNGIEYNMNAGAAVSAPRLHHQWLPDVLWLERGGFGADTVQSLKERGHNIEVRDGWGNANAIFVTEDGTIQGAADPRGEGTAIGL